MEKIEDYPHGTLAGFLGGCRVCDCCASAFANHLSDSGRKLLIFGMNHRQVNLWAAQRRLPERVWRHVMEPARDIRGRRNDYYVVLTGAPLSSEARAILRSSELTKITE